jgi:ssDNA-binding Zn-finger/Zn-ribbon topoisomerase 1
MKCSKCGEEMLVIKTKKAILVFCPNYDGIEPHDLKAIPKGG